jgi:uracil-DNA glycosylase family 4
MKAVSDRLIPHEGPENAKIFFIQDFPSSLDDTILRPLQGRGGELLEEALNNFSLERDAVRIGSLLNYCPAANTFFKASGSWQLEESQKYLREYLKTASHKVLVPMGPRALEFLTHFSDIDKRRGSVYKHGNFYVIPIQDPYITAIDGSRKPALLHDIQKILRVADEGWSEPTYKMYIDPDFYEAEQLTERILRVADRLTVDIESKRDSSYIRCIGFAWKEDEKYYAACFFNDGSFNNNDPIGPNFKRNVSKLLSSSIPKTFHNGMFDTILLAENGLEVESFDYDTMIAQHVLQPELPIGLDYCVSMYTDINYYKDDGKESSDRIDRTKLGVYNCKDVVGTALVRESQLLEFDETASEYFKYKMKQRELATHFSRTGMLVDTERREQLSNLVMGVRDEDYKTLAGIQLLHGSEVFKVTQHQKVKDFLYDTLELPLKTKKDGNVSADEDAVVSLLATVERKIQDLKTEKAKESWRFKLATLKLILRIRGYEKLLSSYININLSPDGRARSWYKFWGTETGRWSASSWYDGTGLNGQTIPREVLEG